MLQSSDREFGMNNYGARNHVADALADLSVLEFGMNTKEKQHTKIMQTNLNTLCVIEENGIYRLPG